MVARDFAKFQIGVPFDGPLHLHGARDAGPALLVTKNSCLHGFLQFGDLHVFLAKLMLVLGFFVLQFDDLLVEFVAIALDFFLLVLSALQLVLMTILHIFELLLQCLSALFLSCQLVSRLSKLCLGLLHLRAHLLAEVDVAHSLLHHEVD